MKVLSVKDVAKALGTSPQNVYKLVYRGHLPARRMGRRWIFLEEEITEFFRSLPYVHPSFESRKGGGV